MSLFCAVLHVDCLLSACLFVKTIAKSGPSKVPIRQLHMVFVALILSWITYALLTWGGQLTRQLQELRMLFLNGLESLVFATKIIPQPNYLTRQMLRFLGLYKDQNIVFIIFYLILLTAIAWS